MFFIIFLDEIILFKFLPLFLFKFANKKPLKTKTNPLKFCYISQLFAVAHRSLKYFSGRT